VSWTAPVNDGGSPITSYTVTGDPGGATATVGGGTTTATLSGLSNGTAYTFTVAATSNAGTSVASAASTAVTPTAGSPTPSSASGTVAAGGTVTTDPTASPTPTSPVSTSVTTPTGGSITIATTSPTDPAPSGYLFGNQQVDITVTGPAPPSTDPLRIVFTIYPQVGQTPDTTTIARADAGGSPTLVPPCDPANPGQAVPLDPCAVVVWDPTTTYIVATIYTTQASRWNEARPSPRSVTVSNSGYSPAQTTLPLGGSLTWTFTGSKAHSATESVGLGSGGAPLFDSGPKNSGTYTAKPFLAAGSYAYKSTVKGDTMTGAVLVPVLVTPVKNAYAVVWATSSLSGYVFDVQYRFQPAGSKKWGAWTKWQQGVTKPSAAFVPNQGAGTYSFHSALRNVATGRKSNNSADTIISVP
jgi:plastocyanin